MVNLDELQGLIDKATPGPWKVYPGHRTSRPSVAAQAGHICTLSVRHQSSPLSPAPRDHEGAVADAKLIAALVNAWPALRDEVVELRQVIEQAEDHLSNADYAAAQDLLWEILHPGSAAHDAAIDAALQSTEQGGEK